MAARPLVRSFCFRQLALLEAFVMLSQGNLGVVSCLSGLFGSFGYICYAVLGRMKCNGSRIIFGNDGASETPWAL